MTRAKLCRYREIVAEQRQIRATMTNIRLDISAPRPPRLDGMPHGGSGGGGIDDTVVRYMSLTQRYEDRLKALCEEQERIETEIARLDYSERMVLRCKYIDGLTWAKIQQTMSRYGLYYSERSLRRIHARAVDKLQDE